MPGSPSARFNQVLSVYAEPLVRGRRVIVVGDAASGIGEKLLELGARLVHVYDPVPMRVRACADRASRGLTLRELPAGDFDVRDGAFDVALVPELGAVAEPGALVTRLRRLVGAGALLAAAKNPKAPRRPGDPARSVEYAELYDLLSLQFSSVRMVAQLPFEGLALAELGDAEDEPAVSVDTQLAGDVGEPERFLALASEDDTRLDPYAIVQVPTTAARVVADDSQVVLAEAQLKAELLEAQLDEQRTASRRAGVEADRVRALEAEVAAAAKRIADAERRAAEHQQRAERLTAEVRQLQEQSARARDQAARASSELDASLRDTEWTSRRVGELEEALAVAAGVEAALKLKVAELLQVPQIDQGAVERLAARADKAAQQLARAEAELAASDEARSREVTQLESSLRERGATIAELEREVARRERIVRELLGGLQDAAPAVPDTLRVAPDDAKLRAKLDRLAADLASREGELQARAWRIAELEEQLAVAPAAAAPDGARLASLEGELDVLRRALAQEHEARRQIESGDALRHAQSELARQATLIEQLSRELHQRQGAAS